MAPVPAVLETIFSVVPFGVLVPVESVPEPAPPPPVRLSRRPRRLILRRDLLTVAGAGEVSELVPVLEPVVLLPPINCWIADAASTGPAPLVFPRGGPFLRMIEVSASEPQAGEAQSRGVPSWTSNS